MSEKIANWRIDSEEERELGLEADKTAEGRRRYVAFYRENDPQYYAKGLEMAEKVLETFSFKLRPGSYDKAEILEDMIYSLHRFGCMFNEYFLFDFYRLNAKGKAGYITDKNRWGYYEILNREENNEIFDNKIKTWNVFRRFYRRDAVMVTGETKWEEVSDFFTRHPDFISKPLCFGTGKNSGGGGNGVCILHRTDEEPTGFLQKLTEKADVICEELIRQHPVTAAFHPQSVNTVRVPAFKTKNGVRLFHPFLRIGVGDSVVDNASRLGINVFVDEKTGELNSLGFDKLGKQYLRHPDTGIVLPGVRLPMWDELVSTITELFSVVEGTNYVGWDMALTESGWAMIEGNRNGQLAAMQFGLRHGVKAEVDDILKEI